MKGAAVTDQGREHGDVRGWRWANSEAGMTLVEVLVAILVLGVILSAVGSMLITSARATVTNERRVQSSAFLTSEHEQLQSIPWRQAALYAEEVPDLGDVGTYPFLADLELDLDLSSTPPTFEGQPIVTIPGPSLTGRLFFVPEPVSAGVQIGIDEREYDIVRVVTERPEGTKRFTTFVTWDVMGRAVTQRFDSERAPTPAELLELEREGVLQFLLAPRPIEVDVDGNPDAGPSIVARFAEPVDEARVTFRPPDEAPTGVLEQTVVLTGDTLVTHHSLPGFVLFTNTDDLVGNVAVTDAGVPIELSYEGEWEVELAATRSGPEDDVSITTTVFVERGEDPPLPRPSVDSVAIPTGVVTPTDVGIYDLNPGRLCQSVELRADVSWASGTIVEEAAVSASYAGVTSQSAPMGETLGGDYARIFAEGSLSPWLPPEGEEFIDRFWVVAVDQDARSSLLASSAPVTFRDASGGECS